MRNFIKNIVYDAGFDWVWIMDDDAIASKDALENMLPFMVSRRAIQAIGLPKAEFFIFLDDHEYCTRLQRCGRIFLAEASTIMHMEKGLSTGSVQKIGINFRPYSPKDVVFRDYIEKRNRIWFETRCSRDIKGIVAVIKSIIHSILRILLIDKKIVSCNCMCFFGEFWMV